MTTRALNPWDVLLKEVTPHHIKIYVDCFIYIDMILSSILYPSLRGKKVAFFILPSDKNNLS
jgi:hypothetical protein